MNSINELFADTDKEELIKKFFSVEFNRFFNYYQKSKDLGVIESRGSDRDGGRDYSKQSDDSRYFINVGSKDGFDWMKLKDFLKEQLELGRDDVFKVDVKDSFSFFNTEKALQEKVLAFFTDFKHEGRFVNVEVSEDKGRSRGGRSGGRSRGGSDRRSSGGSRRRDDKPRGDRRSSDRRSSGGSGNRSDRRSRRSDDSGSDRGDRKFNDSKGDRRSSESSGSSSERPRRSRRN